MEKEFNKGDRVVVNIPGYGYVKDRKATVIGIRCQSDWCIRVIFDGLKTPQTIAKSFCKLLKE